MASLPRGPIEAELRKILGRPMRTDAVENIEIPKIEEHLIRAGRWEPESGESLIQPVKTLIADHIRSVGDEKLEEALLIDFRIVPVIGLTAKGDEFENFQSGTQLLGSAAAAGGFTSADAYSHDKRNARPSPRSRGLRRIARSIDPNERLPDDAVGLWRDSLPVSDAGEAHGETARWVPPKPDSLARLAYRPVKVGDLEKAFWKRDSTIEYVDQLATSESMTIYAGADGNSDVGEPLQRTLFATALIDLMHKSPLLNGIPADLVDETANAAAEQLSQVCGTAYVGSVVQEMARALPHVRNEGWEAAQNTIRTAIHAAIAGRDFPDGLLAEKIVLLALAFASEGKQSRILNNHLDRDICNSENLVRAKYGNWVAGASLREYSGKRRLNLRSQETVPVVDLAGKPDAKQLEPLVLGEADFLAFDGTSSSATGLLWNHRASRLSEALMETTVLFVGTSLTDPGVLAALAATRGSKHPRYALVIPPDPSTDTGGNGADELSVRRLRRVFLRLLAQRYLHFDVVPVFIDFPRQVPQFLTEVAGQAKHGEDFRGYDKRLTEWWNIAATLVGEDPEVRPDDERSKTFELRWQSQLEDLIVPIAQAVESNVEIEPVGDQMIIELWLRNYDDRSLFRWLTTDRAHRRRKKRPCEKISNPESDPTSLISQAFRNGAVVRRKLTPDRGYGVAIPLFVRDAAGCEDPVAVFSVQTRESTKGLAELASEPNEFQKLREMAENLIQAFHSSLMPSPDDDEDPV